MQPSDEWPILGNAKGMSIIGLDSKAIASNNNTLIYIAPRFILTIHRILNFVSF